MNEQANFYKALELLGVKPSPKVTKTPRGFGVIDDEGEKAKPIIKGLCKEVLLYNVTDVASAIRRIVETHNEMVEKGASNVRLNWESSGADEGGGTFYCLGEVYETPEQMVDRLKTKVNVEKRRIEEIKNNHKNLVHFEKRQKEIKKELDKAEKLVERAKKEREDKKVKDDLEKARATVAELEAKQAHGEMDDAMESGKIS